jgi:hypothetical protein
MYFNLRNDVNLELQHITDLLPDFGALPERQYSSRVATASSRRLRCEASFSDDGTFGCRWTVIKSKEGSLLGYHVMLVREQVRVSLPSFSKKPDRKLLSEFIYSQAYNRYFMQSSSTSPPAVLARAKRGGSSLALLEDSPYSHRERKNSVHSGSIQAYETLSAARSDIRLELPAIKPVHEEKKKPIHVTTGFYQSLRRRVEELSMQLNDHALYNKVRVGIHWSSA